MNLRSLLTAMAARWRREEPSVDPRPLLDVVGGTTAATPLPTTRAAPRVTKLIAVPLGKTSRTVPYSSERLIYTRSVDTLGSLDRRSRRFAIEQQARDDSSNTSVPLLKLDIEAFPNPAVTDRVEFMRVKVGAIIATDRYSRTFAVQKNKHLEIKYVSNCEHGPGLNRISREFMMLRYLARFATVPRAYFLSAPTRLQAKITPKTDFYMSMEDRVRCIATNPLASVRFMVTSAVDIDARQTARIYSWDLNQRELLKQATRWIRIGMRNLQQIHEAGVVHGGIDETTVVRIPQVMQFTVGFINWQSGIFASDVRGPPALVREPLAVQDWHASHFEMEGFRSSYRDDVYRLIQVLAVMLNGDSFRRYCESLTPEELLRFKREGFFFSIPGGKDIALGLGRLPPQRVQYVIDALQQILLLIRGVADVDERPDYAEIIAQLTGIGDALSR